MQRLLKIPLYSNNRELIAYDKCVLIIGKILLYLSIKSTYAVAIKSTTNQIRATTLEMHYNECMN